MFARLLAALVLAAMPAFAAAQCQCAKLPPKILFGKAVHVFHALVIGTDSERSPAPGIYPGDDAVVHARFELLEVFKGGPDPAGHVIDRVSKPGRCALGLTAGHTYLLYVDQRDRVGVCEGSRPFAGGPDLLELRKLAEES